RLAFAAAAVLFLGITPAIAGEPCRDCVRAGAARVRLRVPAGTPLAGYGSWARRLLVPDLLARHPHAFWFKPHEGELDPLFARALVVERGDQRLVWVGADLIAVDRDFTRLVARGLAGHGVAAGHLVLSASHTHSGPGAFLHSGVFGVISAEREDPAVRDALVSGLVEAARRAAGSLVDARTGVGAGAAPALTRGRLGLPVDSEIIVVKVVAASGAPVALLWNYAIHGTMLGPRNLMLSGDVMGLAARELERQLGVPALFVNGAVGDVSPERHGRGEAVETAGRLAAGVRAVWDRVPATAPATLRIMTRAIELPAPHLSVKNCVGRWIPAALGVPLGRVLPRDTELTAGLLGHAAWVTIPGELQSRLGETIKRAGAPPGGRAFVAGLSNEYLGYFLAPADYSRPSYVACASFYGPGAGEYLAGVAMDLLAALGRGER
ncbi:MAG: neutral/alkaline non-lysosomal ceramidase N-terminal domain-containing protein, partial [Candidatus Rokubacteria bacterium]|nr:neutral/alkaline non-lysosomal ceramidase N-terminal domain-containing protein [Candidatus Rokubacteria bacterium]